MRIFSQLVLLFLVSSQILFAADDSILPSRVTSWIVSANDPLSDFPLQNLPYGVFKKKEGDKSPRICTAIGTYILDLNACVEANLIDQLNRETLAALQKESLNALMNLDKKQRHLLRQSISELLSNDIPNLRDNFELRERLLLQQAEVTLVMPIEIGDYTDFYASLHHASHVGTIVRPDSPLMPNYKHMPIGYHGRSSSIVVSETPIRWPSGQSLNTNGMPKWDFSQMLDYELEMGAVIGYGNAQGYPISIDQASAHIFGFVLLNDWSARDIQKWEYQPLGPFNGKNFATSISPWIVTSEALEPFRIPSLARVEGDPPLLDYLLPSSNTTFNITVEAYLSSEMMRKANLEPLLICKANLTDLYWSFEQMICHHTSSGCNLRTGDLLGSGTISGVTKEALGCFLERAAFHMPPVELPDGTSRQYLQDGDEIILRAYAQKENYPRIGFGECRGIVLKEKQ